MEAREMEILVGAIVNYIYAAENQPRPKTGEDAGEVSAALNRLADERRTIMRAGIEQQEKASREIARQREAV